MDPLSALSVAAAVVQFIDFGGTIIASTYKIHKSRGKEGEGTDVASIATRLANLNSELERSATFSPTSQIDRDIVILCQQCNKAATSLLDALRELNAASSATLWDSFKIALRTVWSQGEIDALQTRLETYRQQISMHILAGLRAQMQALQKSNEARDSNVNVSLQTTQQLAKQILGVVDEQRRFQSDIVRAINRTNSWTGTHHPPKSLDPGRLDARDLESFNTGLLHILKFHEIGMRERTIADPHNATLGWLFHPASNASGTTFADWLTQDVSFYWIAGKAGSGKSTLMKHLYESQQLTDRLKQWAGGDELRILCFYFWNASTNIQMSLEGLVRTLLFQALEKDKHFIPKCFPNRFETRLMFPDEAVFRPPLTWEELLDALKVYLQEASKERKLFLLIDGLDEFGGQPLEVINFISTLPAARVKVCVSSRPWIAFEDAFRSKPSFRLDEYTKDDIRSFVEGSFRDNPGFVAREQLDPAYAAKVIDNVTEKASGVFLWVSLVVRSLMEGFSGGERLSDLQERLDDLPADIEELFLKILNKLSTKQLQNSAHFFQMLRLARRRISSLEFSFADEDSAENIYKMDIAPLPDKVKEARIELLRRRLNECCKGLIEVTTYRGKAMLGGHVSYLHRTVSDFWNKPENKKRLVSLQGPNFNPYTRLCLARIAMLKVIPDSDQKGLKDALMYGIGYAKAAEGRTKSSFPQLFVELARVSYHRDVPLNNESEHHATQGYNEDRLTFADTPIDPPEAVARSPREPVVQSGGFANDLLGSPLRCLRGTSQNAPGMIPTIKEWSADTALPQSPAFSNFMALAAILRLKSYMDYLMTTSEQPTGARERYCSIALHYVLLADLEVSEEYLSVIDVAKETTTYAREDLMKALLKAGADPNMKHPTTGRTAWESLFDFYDYPTFDIASAFIKAGADPNALLSHQYKHWVWNKNRDGQRIYDLCKQAKRHNRGSLRPNFTKLWSSYRSATGQKP